MSDESGVERTVRVWRLEQGEPVHAQATMPIVDFGDLVGITIGRGQSSTMGAINLMVDVSFGHTEVLWKGKKYILALRNARLLLQLENATIEAGTSYRSYLQRGEITQIEKATSTKTASLGQSVNVEGEVEGGWRTIIPILSAKLRVDAKTDGSKNKSTGTSTEVSTTARLALVAPAGQDRWTIGCPVRGDPRQENGWLLGDIISANHGDDQTPLCILSARDQERPVFVRLMIRADRENFSLIEGRTSNVSIEDLMLRFRKMNATTLARRIRAERELKSRIAVLAATKKGDVLKAKEAPPYVLELTSRAASIIPLSAQSRT